jgi:acetolactate synthase I/II/III large subunit
MSEPVSRRTALKTIALTGMAALPGTEAQAGLLRRGPDGSVSGKLTGAQALVETLLAEGTCCVFGIPGAQENELWDVMKTRKLPYLLVTHEFSAAAMADGCARSTGRPGVLCVVPGPGLTNSLSGIGEALLDSVPLVCIVGDVARGDKYRPFQVHELPQVGLLEQVTKGVFEVKHQAEIPDAVRRAFLLAKSGEPGPAGVVVPYNLLIETYKYHSPPLGEPGVPFDAAAFECALRLLANRRWRVGIYAGLGCMDFAPALAEVAELLQAPVATSVSGKGVLDECHPLAVGWGYGAQGTTAAEEVFKHVDVVLAIGVRYSEVSTAFYSIPKVPHLIHVDINENNLGRIVKTEVCVHADAGVFLARVLEHADELRRAPDGRLQAKIRKLKEEDARRHQKLYARCGADPMAFLLTLRCLLNNDALVFVDVTLAEHWAAEAFTVFQPRTYFNPTDNQAMGWSVPAALGAQVAHPGRQVVTVTGDGCFLMSAMEISTAARAGLPVKFFILDDQAYRYMQVLQHSAYRRTTATLLARLDYAALAQALGVGYQEIGSTAELEAGIRGALSYDGPVLVRVVTDYGKRPVRWVDAAKKRYTDELSAEQKLRFLARISSRTLQPHPWND